MRSVPVLIPNLLQAADVFRGIPEHIFPECADCLALARELGHRKARGCCACQSQRMLASAVFAIGVAHPACQVCVDQPEVCGDPQQRNVPQVARKFGPLMTVAQDVICSARRLLRRVRGR